MWKHRKRISRRQQVQYVSLYLTHFLQPWQRIFYFFFLGRCDSITLYQITLVPAPLVLSARLTFIRNTRINKATWRPPESKIKAIRHFTEHYPNYNNKRERGSAHAFVNIHRRDGETQSERKNTQLGQTDGAGCLKKGRKKKCCPYKTSYKYAPLTNEVLC